MILTGPKFLILCPSWSLSLSFFNIYLVIDYLFILAALGLSCGMRTLSCGMYAGSSSPTRDWTRAPCIGSAESYPLDHQGRPPSWSLFKRQIVLCQCLPSPFWGQYPFKVSSRLNIILQVWPEVRKELSLSFFYHHSCINVVWELIYL